MKKVKFIELDDCFKIGLEKPRDVFVLVEKRESYKWNQDRTEKIKSVKTKEYAYSSLYECLKAYLRKSVNKSNTLSDIQKTIKRVLLKIDSAEAELKANFRTEVIVRK